MSKKSLHLNRTLLISLVRERPAIWDKTMNIYKCQRAKQDAWRDICLVLKKDYERMEQNQKKEYFKQVIRMWTHIRDSWMKSMKDKINKKALTKPYVYHEQLLFLLKILKPGEVHETIANTDEIKHEEGATEEKRVFDNPGNSGFSKEIPEMIEDDSHREMTKKSLIINRTQLINLVRERPAIWDKTSDIYKNKHAKSKAWRDICLIMNEYYKQMDRIRRKEYFNLLTSIWTQIRDTWMRSIKNKSSRPYKYHEKMLFLKKIITPGRVLENIENSGDNDEEAMRDEENERESVDTNFSSLRTQNLDEVDRDYPYFVDSQTKNTTCQTEMEDRNYCFFKSIQPTLAFFNDDQILQFQAGTINLLQKIKTGQKCSELQQHRTPTVRGSLTSVVATSSLRQDPIKLETYDLT